MAYCVKCGAKVQDGAKFCPECGAKIPGSQTDSREKEQYTYTNQDTWNYNDQGFQNNGYYQYEEEKFHKEDVQRNKVMAVLSYIGILVLIPLLAGNKSSEYVQQHLNQGISLWVASLIVDVITDGSFLGYRLFYHHGWGLSVLGDIVSFVLLILAILGIISACKGTKKPLPVVGSIRIFK